MANINPNGNFAKTICSICYEDLKPIVEDLQAISSCGHVFHELCLQQWFEYCTGKSKKSCPVCKQTCSDKNACRLYFQSAGDSNDIVLSQKPKDFEGDAEALHIEARRLEGKVSGLNAILEGQGKELALLNEKLYSSKEQAKNEAALKDEALRQRASIQKLLLLKSEELQKSNLECSKLQEKNMALAKELAALKLVSDLNVDEDEVLKLASFGKEGNSKETIDVLRRSSYRELMAKCNNLGRGEAHSSKKLEKAKNKISKLKARVQELEAAAEAKDNEILRALKVAKTTNSHQASREGLCSGSTPVGNGSMQNQCEKSTTTSFSFYPSGSLEGKASRKRGKLDSDESVGISHTKGSVNKSSFEETVCHISNKENGSKPSVYSNGPSTVQQDRPKHQDLAVARHYQLRTESFTDNKTLHSVSAPSNLPELSTTHIGSTSDKESVTPVDMDDEVILLDNSAHIEPVLNIRKENSASSLLSRPGDLSFAGGLLGPDGTNRYLGKWCKRGQHNGSTSLQGPSTSTGELIAIGADGRGGRIKVLKSRSQSSLVTKENTSWTKRCKLAQTSSSQGSLQIEHFFGRASHQ